MRAICLVDSEWLELKIRKHKIKNHGSNSGKTTKNNNIQFIKKINKIVLRSSETIFFCFKLVLQ